MRIFSTILVTSTILLTSTIALAMEESICLKLVEKGICGEIRENKVLLSYNLQGKKPKTCLKQNNSCECECEGGTLMLRLKEVKEIIQ
jgi:hypothetical protein